MEIIIKPTTKEDRFHIEELVGFTEIFTDDEKDSALELLDMYFEESELMAEINEDFEKEYNFLSAFVSGDSDDNTPIGFICYGDASFSDGTTDLYYVVIHKDFRKNGVARSLFNSMYDRISSREEKLRMIIAETSSQASFSSARGFYESLDMAEESRIKDFFKSGDDKIFYIKRY